MPDGVDLRLSGTCRTTLPIENLSPRRRSFDRTQLLISSPGSQVIVLMDLQLNQASANCQHPQNQGNRHKEHAAMRIFGTWRFVGSSTTGHSTLQTCDHISDQSLFFARLLSFQFCRRFRGDSRGHGNFQFTWRGSLFQWINLRGLHWLHSQLSSCSLQARRTCRDLSGADLPGFFAGRPAAASGPA